MAGKFKFTDKIKTIATIIMAADAFLRIIIKILSLFQ